MRRSHSCTTVCISLVILYGKVTGCVKVTSAPMAAADPTAQPAAVRRSCRAVAPLAGWLCSAAACDASSVGLDACHRRLAAVDLEDAALVAKQAAAEEEIGQVCGPTCNTRSRCSVSVVSVLLIGRKMQLAAEYGRRSGCRDRARGGRSDARPPPHGPGPGGTGPAPPENPEGAGVVPPGHPRRFLS